MSLNLSQQMVGEREMGPASQAFIHQCLEGMRPTEGLTNPHSLTLVDIECDIPRAGLGPDHLDLLSPEKEDIGLSEPVVLQDYLSPPRRSSGPFEVHLSPGSIDKCRRACADIKPKGKHREGAQSNIPRVHKEKCKECDWIAGLKTKKPGKDADYFVEFPPDEMEGVCSKSRHLDKEEELQLSIAVRESLSLKRSRLALQWDEQNTHEDGEEDILKKKKKSRHGEQDMEVSTEGDQLCFSETSPMVEDAGLPMPPQSQ